MLNELFKKRKQVHNSLMKSVDCVNKTRFQEQCNHLLVLDYFLDENKTIDQKLELSNIYDRYLEQGE